MAAGDLNTRDRKAIAALKRVRTERLRPIRAAVADLPCNLRMNDWDSEVVYVQASCGGCGLAVYLREPFDLAAVCAFLHDCLDDAEEYLDRQRNRVMAVERRLEAGGTDADA